MGIYAMKPLVTISPKRVLVKEHEMKLPLATITIRELMELGIGDDEEISIHYDDYCGDYILCWAECRDETPEEVAERVAAEEDYNRRYDEYHANKEHKAREVI